MDHDALIDRQWCLVLYSVSKSTVVAVFFRCRLLYISNCEIARAGCGIVSVILFCNVGAVHYHGN